MVLTKKDSGNLEDNIRHFYLNKYLTKALCLRAFADLRSFSLPAA